MMRRSIKYFVACVFALLLSAAAAYAQPDRKEVRSGNKDFRKGEWREAEVDYMKALVKDSMSFAANYNLAATLYRQEEHAKAKETLEKMRPYVSVGPHASDYYYNLGDVAIALKDWKTAVDAFGNSLLINPGDVDAKENFIYARKMLQNQQQNGGEDNSGDNEDKNDDNSQDNGNEKNNDSDGKDRNQDENDGGNNGEDKRNDDGNGQPQLTPQAAQQMLQAIQAKEKETQDKVKKAKAAAAKSRQKEKNW